MNSSLVNITKSIQKEKVFQTVISSSKRFLIYSTKTRIIKFNGSTQSYTYKDNKHYNDKKRSGIKSLNQSIVMKL